MQAHPMSKRRSEVPVAALRPLAINRATTEVVPARGTLFLKVIKGTQLIQAPKLPQQRERKLQDRLSALLRDARAESGTTIHAVSVTSWLTEAESEARTPRDAAGLGLTKRSSFDDSTSSDLGDVSPSTSLRSGLIGTGDSKTGGSGMGSGSLGDSGQGRPLSRRIPRAGAARTSTKFVSPGDAEGGASWEEEFFFARVAGEAAVRIVCIDKPLTEGAEDEVVGEALIPVSRLPQNEPVEQWYGLQPPAGSGMTFTTAALLLRFLFTTASSPPAAAAAAAAAASGNARNSSGTSGAVAAHPGTSLIPSDQTSAPGVSAGPQGFAQQGGVHGRGVDGTGEDADRRVDGQVGSVARGDKGAGGDGDGVSGALSGGTPTGDAFSATGSSSVRLEVECGGLDGYSHSPARSRLQDVDDQFVADPSIDPFGSELDEDEADRLEASLNVDDLVTITPDRLQLGKWGGTTTLHAGAAAAEAALALSKDEVLPSGLVDYFLVVGPASDENGRLQVADYANCGFGSSRAPPTAAAAAAAAAIPGEASEGAERLVPATTVEVESAVLEHFPQDQREDAPFPTKVEWFCFPNGLFLVSSAGQPAPHVSSFVRFTSGVRSYGLCLTFYRQVDTSEAMDAGLGESTVEASPDTEANGGFSGMAQGLQRRSQQLGRRRSEGLWCPLCLCVLTHIPVLDGLMNWLRMFHWCLVRLEREAGGTRRGQTPSELDAAVFQLTLEVPLPVPGVCNMAIKAFGKRFAACPEPEFALPGVRELPPLSFPLSLLLRCLRPQGVLQLLAAVLQEGRILLHSEKPALLAAVAEGIFALMYPLQWPYAYVPVLPSCLIEHVESPQPFILGVKTEWLSAISPDALQELIVVDCDLGSIGGCSVEPLPAPIRRTLTQAVRAILHGDLGNLDAAIRLSKPLRGGRRVSSSGSRDAVVGSAPGGQGDGFSRPVSQRGGEKSGEAGDGDGGRGDGVGVGEAGGSRESPRKAVRRGREKGAEARAEALLRLEFARAMADMLHGFAECLFFLHPERPIFNAVRFLQEYCKESYVRFMSIVIDTLAFKYLLETQDLPALRPFHAMLDKASRGGEDGQGQVSGIQSSRELGYAGVFNGPFPTGIANGNFGASLANGGSRGMAGWNGAGGNGREDAETGAGAIASALDEAPPPAFTISAPRRSSFALHKPDGGRGAMNEEIDFNASRGKCDEVSINGVGRETDGAGRVGGRSGVGDEVGSKGDGGRETVRGDLEIEQAAEETRQDVSPRSSSLPPPTPTRAGLGGVDSEGNSRGRSRDRLSDPRGGLVRQKALPRLSPGRLSRAAGGDSGGDEICSPVAGAGKGEYGVEADEMADEGEEDAVDDSKAAKRARGRRRPVDRRASAPVPDATCYDSAGEWASDGSEGWPPVLGSHSDGRRSSVDSSASGPASGGAPPPRALGSRASFGRPRSSLSRDIKVRKESSQSDVVSTTHVPIKVGEGRKGEEDSDNDDGAQFAKSAEDGGSDERSPEKAGEAEKAKTVESAEAQAAGESALEEARSGEGQAATGEGTAPPEVTPAPASTPAPAPVPTVGAGVGRGVLSHGRSDSAADISDRIDSAIPPPIVAPSSPPKLGIMTPSREALVAGSAGRRKSEGMGGGGRRGGIMDRIKMFEAAAASGGGSQRPSAGFEKQPDRRKRGNTTSTFQQAVLSFQKGKGGAGSASGVPRMTDVVGDTVAAHRGLVASRLSSPGMRPMVVLEDEKPPLRSAEAPGAVASPKIEKVDINPSPTAIPTPPPPYSSPTGAAKKELPSSPSSPPEESQPEPPRVPAAGSEKGAGAEKGSAAAGEVEPEEQEEAEGEAEEEEEQVVEGSEKVEEVQGSGAGEREDAQGRDEVDGEAREGGLAEGGKQKEGPSEVAHGDGVNGDRGGSVGVPAAGGGGDGTATALTKAHTPRLPWKPESSPHRGFDGDYEPVVVPLSLVVWSHDPVLRLGDCELPEARKWTLGDVGKEIGEDLGEALRAQLDGSSSGGLGHGAYSLKAGAGLAAAAASAGEGEELDWDSEKLLECLGSVYSSERVSEEDVARVDETLRTKPTVQEMFLQVLQSACRRGLASNRGPTLLDGPSFETLARFSWTLLCVCVDNVDYSVAHTLLQLTGAYYQVHEGGGGLPGQPGGPNATGLVGSGTGNGGDGADGEAGFFSESLSARISRHMIFLKMGFWLHVLQEAVQAKTEKLARASKSRKRGGADSVLSSPDSTGPRDQPKSPGTDTEVEGNGSSEWKDPLVTSEIICRQVKVFLHEMASIGVPSKTAQKLVELVSHQYKLQRSARNRLKETVRVVWGAGASLSGAASPMYGESLTQSSVDKEALSRAVDLENSLGHRSTASDAILEPVGQGPPPVRSSLTAGGETTGDSASHVAISDPNFGGSGSRTAPGVASSRTAEIESSGGMDATVSPPSALAASKPTLKLGGSVLASQLHAESSPSPRPPTTPKGGSTRYLGSMGPPQNLGDSLMGPLPAPSSRAKALGAAAPLSPSASMRGHLGPMRSLSPRGISRSKSLMRPPSGFPSRGGMSELSPRRPLMVDTVGVGASPDEEEANAGEGATVSSVGTVSTTATRISPAAGAGDGNVMTGAGASKGGFFFGPNQDAVRALTSSSSSTSGPTAVSPSPAPRPPPPRTPVQRSSSLPPPSVLPAEPTGDSDGFAPSSTASGQDGPRPGAANARATTPGSPGSAAMTPPGGRKGWAENPGGNKGELPSLFAPVELHARDSDGVGHQGPILCLAANGSRACAGSTDCTVSVYDLGNVARVATLTGHTGPVTSVACGEDWVVSASTDSTIRLWHNAGDSGGASTPPRRGFISLGWQAPYGTAGSFRVRAMTGHEGGVASMTAHPRRVEGLPWLALSGGEDNNLRLWDLRSRRCKVIFTGHTSVVTCLSELKDDGSYLVLSGAKDCSVRLWDINESTGYKALRKFSGHEGSVGAILKIGPFAAVSCSNDRTLRTWDHRVKGSVGVLRGHTGPVTCVQQMPANRSMLASGSSDGTVMMWDVRATAKGPTHTLRGHRDRVTRLLASGASIYSCSEDGSMYEWVWETGELKSKFYGSGGRASVARGGVGGAKGGGQSGGITCVAATEKAVLTAGWDRTVRMWPRSSPTPPSDAELANAAAAAANAVARAGGHQ